MRNFLRLLFEFTERDFINTFIPMDIKCRIAPGNVLNPVPKTTYYCYKVTANDDKYVNVRLE